MMELKDIKREIIDLETFEARLCAALAFSELEHIIRSACEDDFFTGSFHLSKKILEIDLLLNRIKFMEAKERTKRDAAFYESFSINARANDPNNKLKRDSVKLTESTLTAFSNMDQKVVLRTQIINRIVRRKLVVESVLAFLDNIRELLKLRYVHGDDKTFVPDLDSDDYDIMYDLKKTIASIED